jgi:hypothetical protein
MSYLYKYPMLTVRKENIFNFSDMTEEYLDKGSPLNIKHINEKCGICNSDGNVVRFFNYCYLCTCLNR